MVRTTSDTDGSSTSAATTLDGSSGAPEPSTTTGTDTGTGTTGTTTSTSNGSFIDDTDTGVEVRCSIWDQDCAPGEKCTFWASDGGNAWNATKCSPIAPDPAGVGEPCEVEGSGVSGIDTCDLHSMCFYVDPETLMGECVGFCVGEESDPTCVDEEATCSISADGVILVCLPTCAPLLQDCLRGRGCYGSGQDFECMPDASGDEGAAGDPCEYVNACDPGLQCVNAEGVPGCAGSQGCCSPHCDLSDPLASQGCPGFAGGQECVPWFDRGTAPAGYEDVGICIIPP